jgi:hypothetical protein
LTALIARAVDNELLGSLVGILALHRLPLYTNDVVILFKPEVQDLRTIKELIAIFGKASGFKVNYRKRLLPQLEAGKVSRRACRWT